MALSAILGLRKQKLDPGEDGILETLRLHKTFLGTEYLHFNVVSNRR
jgi:hypothetical protein